MNIAAPRVVDFRIEILSSLNHRNAENLERLRDHDVETSLCRTSQKLMRVSRTNRTRNVEIWVEDGGVLRTTITADIRGERPPGDRWLRRDWRMSPRSRKRVAAARYVMLFVAGQLGSGRGGRMSLIFCCSLARDVGSGRAL